MATGVFCCSGWLALNAAREEVEEVLGMAIYMGGGPSLMYAADALMAYEQFKEKSEMAAR